MAGADHSAINLDKLIKGVIPKSHRYHFRVTAGSLAALCGVRPRGLQRWAEAVEDEHLLCGRCALIRRALAARLVPVVAPDGADPVAGSQ